MPHETGTIIDGDEQRESAVSSAANRDSKSSGRTGDGEIVSGFDVESPDTERIGTADIDTGTTRRTKRGSIDRRTKLGRQLAADPNAATGTKEEPVHLSSKKIDLASAIFGLHLTLATFVKCEELALEMDEAQELSDVIKDVGKYYGASFDPKKVAIFNACVCAAKIYGTRAYAIRQRLKTERGPKLVQEKPAKTKVNSVPAPPQEISLKGMSPSQLSGFASAEL